MAKLISKTYGEALFELAVEEAKTEEFLGELTEIRLILEANPDFTRLMNHPKIRKEEKCAVLTECFKGRISDELTGFLLLIVTKDRYREIETILDYFCAEVKKLQGIGVAHIVSAITLTEIRKAQIEERLLSVTDFRQMEMHFSVDASLIGGMVIRIGDRVVDSSVKSKLAKLQKQLLTTQITPRQEVEVK
ncbi:MAG: ATP synthase F1 subunit delta [Lachnospiraceae bacterium]|jgi:F-type H+-transporting ATPase subunit delta|nr:ATP synthase F1 subunit delta [Lachnospiraceae bacterium]